MDKKALVEKDIENGRKLIDALDKTKFKVKAALWFYLIDSNDWRLIIASPFGEKNGIKEAYNFVREELIKLSIHPELSLKDISIISPKDNLVRLLTRAIVIDPGISGVRFTHNVIDNVLIDDAYIYRITK